MCDDKEKFICYECVGENYLRLEIENEGEKVECSYCSNNGIECYSLSVISSRVELAFEQHYMRSSEYPPEYYSTEHLKSLDLWEPEGIPIREAIADALEISDEAAADIQEILASNNYDRSSAEIGEYSEFHDESFYDFKAPDDKEWQVQWANFELSVKTRSRFFSKENEELLKSVFSNLDVLKTHDQKPIIRFIGPGSDLEMLHRARAFQSDIKLQKALEQSDKEIGPPPAEFATAGRMNARGISVFYGATSLDTALSEIRPPVGSKVVVASFKILRKLKVLDLSALSYTATEGSIFDRDYSNLVSKSMFLRKLSQRMTRPVMPDDEHFEYLATQVIADFLASEYKYDGIIFPSAQSRNGVNIIFFNHASAVQSIKRKSGARTIASLYDRYDEQEVPEYTVTTINPKIAKEEKSMIWDLPWISEKITEREDTLSIDMESITVEHVKSIQINRDSFPINLQEYEGMTPRPESDIMEFGI